MAILHTFVPVTLEDVDMEALADGAEQATMQLVEVEIPDEEWDARFTDADFLASMAESTRQKRNQELKDSDWSVGSDSPLTEAQKELWRTYRQELRDITTHANFPNLAIEDWPEPPA